MAGSNITSCDALTVVGSRAGTKGGAASTFVGSLSGNTATGASNTAVGSNTMLNASGTGNTAVGQQALRYVTSGSDNVALGYCSLRYILGSNTAHNYSDCVGLGANTRTSADHQMQLGNSGQTPYAYAALQLRSDARDKADVRNTVLGSDFILGLRPVDFRWDIREDYDEVVDDGMDENDVPMSHIVQRDRDGTRKRNRFHHGFIAQEVKAKMDELGVDFGGYQDHKINGGADVLSLGYEELIAPMVKTIQELAARIEELEAKING